MGGDLSKMLEYQYGEVRIPSRDLLSGVLELVTTADETIDLFLDNISAVSITPVSNPTCAPFARWNEEVSGRNTVISVEKTMSRVVVFNRGSDLHSSNCDLKNWCCNPRIAVCQSHL